MHACRIISVKFLYVDWILYTNNLLRFSDFFVFQNSLTLSDMIPKWTQWWKFSLVQRVGVAIFAVLAEQRTSFYEVAFSRCEVTSLLSVMMDKMRVICEIYFSFNFSLGSDEPVVILLFWIISLLPWQQRPLGYHGYLTLWLKEKTNNINRRQKNKRKFSKKMIEDKTRISPLDSSNGKCRV